MAAGRRAGRAGICAPLFALALALCGPVLAQEALVTGSLPILTLDQDRFFLESAFGRASIERELAATRALEEENKRIEAELIAEEQALTGLRRSLAAEEFTQRADAFDQKVERIRAEQDAKARALTEGRDADRNAFLQAAIPVLGELLSERRAVAIIDKTTIILSLTAIDVTDAAIAKVDAALGDEKPVPDAP